MKSNSKKTYSYSIALKIGPIIMSAILLYGIIEGYRTIDHTRMILYGVCLLIMLCMGMSAFVVRISVDNKGVKLRGMVADGELMWADIAQLTDEVTLGKHIYKIISGDASKSPMVITTKIYNYKELLRDISKNAPKARIDKSIKKLLNN